MGKEIIKKKYKIEWDNNSYNAVDVSDIDGNVVTIASINLWNKLYPNGSFVSADAKAKDNEMFGYIDDYHFDSDEDILIGIRNNWEDEEIFDVY